MLVTKQINVHRIFKGTWRNLLFSVFACTIAYIVNELWLKNIFSFPAFVPTILGTALAFFIGFNNNQAYDRWWESRKIWGSIVNNSRTWGRSILYYTNTHEPQVKETQKELLLRHIAFLYALKANLRGIDDESFYSYLSEEEIDFVKRQTNKHNAILSLQSQDLNGLYQDKVIDGFQFIELNKMITAHCDDMGRSERIKNTVFPTTYTYYSEKFIWIFIYSVTMTIGVSIGVWAIVFGTLLGYVFFTIHTIGDKLLNPFDNSNIMGIPLDQITRTIEINLLEMLGEETTPPPVQVINNEYIM